MIGKVVAFVGFSLLVLSSFAQETFTHEGSGLQFTLPAGWTYTSAGDHFEAASPDEEVYLLFFVGRDGEAAAAIDAVVEELSGIIHNPTISSEYTEEKVNGLTQVYVEGDGLVDGDRIDWDLSLIEGSRKSMVVVAFGAIEENHSTIQRIYRSIRE